jgi:hypothetical protein
MELVSAVFKTAVKDDFTSIFCSELVASGFKVLDLLPASIAASNYLPRDFSETYDKFLKLQGAKLEKEIRLSVTMPQPKNDEKNNEEKKE